MALEFQIHLPRHLRQHVEATEGHFYARLARGLEEMGATVRVVDRAPLNIPPDPFDGNYHFVHQGFHKQQNVLNTGPAYIHPYFYADTEGTYGESSILNEEFDPISQPIGKAKKFVAKLAERIAYSTDQVEIPERDAVVLFLQPFNETLERTTRLTQRDLVRGAISAAQGRKLIIRTHPGAMDDQLSEFLARIDRQRGNIAVTDAPISEVLASAKVTLSFNSPHALEGMCLGIPAVLCARSDLQHNAVACHDFMEISNATEEALSRTWHHEAFVYWFLFRKMINGGGDRFVETTLRRIRMQGVNLKQFGVELS